MVGLDQGVKLEESDQEFLSTQAPGIPPLAPHASLGINDAQAASLALVSRGSVVGLDQGVKSERSDQKFLSTQAPGIPPLAPHASLGIDDAQAASLVVVLLGVGGWARPG